MGNIDIDAMRYQLEAQRAIKEAIEDAGGHIKEVPPVKHKSMFEPDNVIHPAHYQTNIKGLETIDMIYAVLGPERFEGYCRGNALKYLARADDKGNTIEDLRKAIVYIKWEIEIRKKENKGND